MQDEGEKALAVGHGVETVQVEVLEIKTHLNNRKKRKNNYIRWSTKLKIQKIGSSKMKKQTRKYGYEGIVQALKWWAKNRKKQ